MVKIAREASPPECLIVSGVNAVIRAWRRHGRRPPWRTPGRTGYCSFPPNSWALGHDDEAVKNHHRYIRDATSLPLLLYGAPVGSGAMAYSPRLLQHLAGEDRVVGIKEGSWEVAAYEANLRLLRSLRPDFVVLGSGDEHLLTSYIIGSAGSQVSLAAVIPDLVVALWAAAAGTIGPRPEPRMNSSTPWRWRSTVIRREAAQPPASKLPSNYLESSRATRSVPRSPRLRGRSTRRSKPPSRARASAARALECSDELRRCKPQCRISLSDNARRWSSSWRAFPSGSVQSRRTSRQRSTR